MVSGPMEDGKQMITQADLDEVRGYHPDARIMPVFEGFEATIGGLVIRRRTLLGLDIAVSVAENRGLRGVTEHQPPGDGS
jgi:hypothetical protein